MNALIQKFFEDHHEKLSQFYPGLKLDYLIEKLSEADCDLEESFAYCLEGRPLEYIAKSKFFYRSSFYIDERVLIPRNETEILVEDVIDQIKKNQWHSLAEIGVGSGAISLSIAQECNDLAIWAGDLSSEALEVARVNREQLESQFARGTSVELIESDRLAQTENKFDCIVSNPPYIKQTDTVHPMVRKFEPEMALFINDQEYHEWFDQLFKQVKSCLNEEGQFFMEGHEDHLEELKNIAQNYFSDVKLKKDYTGRLRILNAKM